MTAPVLDVVCLCAQWCGNCRDYLPVFESMRERFSGLARLTWIDIEDQSEVLGETEVENFPTLLILRGELPLFLGPLTPQPAMLAQLVQSALDGRLPVQADPALQALAGRVRQHLVDSIF
ncbi:MAG: thioredoxin family protein [Curvibacter sp.]